MKSKTTGKYDNADYELTAEGDEFIMRKTKFGQMNINEVMGDAGFADDGNSCEMEQAEMTKQAEIEGEEQKLLGDGETGDDSDGDGYVPDEFPADDEDETNGGKWSPWWND